MGASRPLETRRVQDESGSRDGSGFLVVERADGGQGARIHVVLDWMQELEKLF